MQNYDMRAIRAKLAHGEVAFHLYTRQTKQPTIGVGDVRPGKREATLASVSSVRARRADPQQDSAVTRFRSFTVSQSES